MGTIIHFMHGKVPSSFMRRITQRFLGLDRFRP